MKKYLCPICGSGSLKRKKEKIEFRYNKKSISLSQPGEYCESCSEGILDPADIKATQKILHDFRSTTDGFLSTEEIRSVRKRLGLTQRQASQVFGGGTNAFSRYERGVVRQPKALDLLLKLFSKYPNLFKEL